MRGRMLRLRGAFTLIEMLTVMAVVAVLMALLMPALSSAREKARRTACLAQFQQIGLALSLYGTAYSQYYPSWPGWHFSRGAAAGDIPYMWARTQKDGRVIAQGNHLGDYVGPARSLTIAWRSAENVPPWVNCPIDNAPPEDDQYSVAACGLGQLMVTEMLSDGRALFCPSSPGVWKTHYGWDVTYEVRSDLFRRIGGASPRSLEYPRNALETLQQIVGYKSWVPNSEDRGFLCSFAYRGKPTVMAPEWSTDAAYIVESWPGVKPALRVENGCPPFKTEKQLGARCIVSDAFDYAFLEACPWFFDEKVFNPASGGAVRHGHREGYNVLYGDGRARWHGDPQRAIAYYKNGGAVQGVWDFVNLTCANSYDFHGVNAEAAGGNGFVTTQEVWHLFDAAAGLDAQ